MNLVVCNLVLMWVCLVIMVLVWVSSLLVVFRDVMVVVCLIFDMVNGM